MRAAWFVLIGVLLAGNAAAAATLGEASVGFSADRTLVINGKTYTGRMWNMPGEERHEQNLNGIPSVFILKADTPIGEAVLPQLHTVVQFVLPPELHLLANSRLAKHAMGHDLINGVATTKYAVEGTVPEGHGTGTLWLSADGIPMRLAATFTSTDGKVATLRWELNHVKLGPQPATLFATPANYSKLPAAAIVPLLGLRLKGAH